MRPVIVMPIHDPSGGLLPHLLRVMPQLVDLFAEAFIGITAGTAAAQGEWVAWLNGQEFFRCMTHRPGLAVGDQFRELYTVAASTYPPDQIVHLCFPDRLAFILQSGYRDAFAADIRAVGRDETPLIFQRTAKAWATHPRNYRELEGMMTALGRLLFGRSLDFAWCHCVFQAGQLREVMPQTVNHDLSMVVEMVLPFRNIIQARDVDWLAWEDPFLEGRPTRQLKQEREQSPLEIRKRLSYVLPALQLLSAAADGKGA